VGEPSRGAGFVWVTVAYVIALLAAVASGYVVRDQHPLVVAAVGDTVGTVVIFLFSVRFSNSSFYDAYWSVAPIALGVYWMWAADNGELLRQVLVLALVSWWGVRLTYNWARGWQGLGHEDWRYIDLRAKTGAMYWLVSFSGIHFFPTVIVFVGCLGMYVAMTFGGPLNAMDGLAAIVTGGAVLLEMVSDKQLRRFVMSKPPREAVLQSGLWAYSRHPNYLGEVSFWTGLFLFAIAADTSYWWTVVGPLSMLALFVFISIPMIERRHLARRPAYAELQARVPMLFPFPRG